jgi:hypothetical protein
MVAKHKPKARAQSPNRGVLGLVCEYAVNALARVDGRASGLKFNKLVCEVHEIMSHATDHAFRFALPRRWYLYGEVVDAAQVWNIVRFQHPDDEFGTNVDIVPGGPRSRPDGFADELGRITKEFAVKYRGPEGIEPMLRHHYERAPYPFQRGFLHWSQLTRGIINGYNQDDTDAVAKAFTRLEGEYPVDLDERLTTAFNRLTLYLGPSVQERRFGDLRGLDRQERVIWDFWKAFCLFLSVKHNSDEPRDEVERFRKHAEVELVAYQRRLVTFLEREYLDEPRSAQDAEGPSAQVATALADGIIRALTDGF